MTGSRTHRNPVRARPSRLLCLGLGFFSAALCFFLPSAPFDSLDQKLYDLRLRWRNRIFPRPLSDRILLIGIDEYDHYINDQELISREAYALLLQTLRQHQPEAVVFDVAFINRRSADALFANHLLDTPTFLAVFFRSEEPFNRKPTTGVPTDLAKINEILPRLQSPADLWKIIKNLLEYEDNLIDEQKNTPFPDSQDPTQRNRAEKMQWVRFIIDEYVNRYYSLATGIEYKEIQGGEPFEGRDLLLPSPELLRSARGAGFINVQKGGEEIIRRAPLVYLYGNRLFPSLDLQVVLHHYGASFSECRLNLGRFIEFPIHRNGQGLKRIPVDERGQYLINFREGESYLRRLENNKTLSYYLPQYAHLRKSSRMDALLQGSIILVGDTASGSTDIQPIPLQANFPLVGVHANVLDSIFRDDFILPVSKSVEVLLLFLMGGILGLIFSERDLREASRISLWLVILYLVAQFAVFFYGNNRVLPIARVVATSLSAYVFLGLYIVGVTERDRRLVKEVFLKSVSPRIGEEILRNFSDPSLWASRRRISVLFADIRGFTPLSERLPPDQLVERLDSYYDTVSEIVFHRDGQVNKFIGDAVLALFGALPGEAPNHAERALRAAMDIQRALTAAHSSTRPVTQIDSAHIEEPLRVGVGINTGEAVVGTVGRRKIRIEYTALGDVVNTASRLQGQAAGGAIYVGGETLEELKTVSPHTLEAVFRFHKVEGLTLKGKSLPVDVYELIQSNPDQKETPL